MAYVAPTTRTTGYNVPASVWNQDVVDNIIALRTGARGLASQAALDFVYASSASQLTRLSASGAAGKFVRFASGVWSFVNPGIAAWPIGSIFIAVVSTNPATLLGFGTWVAFGAGRALVGIDAGQTEFDVVEETGGAKVVTLATAELPVHTHVQNSHNHTQNSHGHTQNVHNHAFADNGHTHRVFLSTVAGTSVVRVREGAAGGLSVTCGFSPASVTPSSVAATNQATTATNIATTATNQATGGGGSHQNLQPYVVTYMWKRTA